MMRWTVIVALLLAVSVWGAVSAVNVAHRVLWMILGVLYLGFLVTRIVQVRRDHAKGRSSAAGNLKRIRAELRQGFLLRKWTGLVLILAGVVVACVGGVLMGQFLYGSATGTAAAVCIGAGLASAAIGNLIWQRGRILARRIDQKAEG